MRTKKSWNEKLADSKGLPKIGEVMGKMTQRWGTGTMVIPAPREVDEYMKRVPRGKLVTINEIRAGLARKHRVDIGCPITTGIFAWIAAHAAEEAAAEGRKKITPYWRTLKSGGELNAKYPGGIPGLKRRLQAEGHIVVKKGKRYFVADFENGRHEIMGEWAFLGRVAQEHADDGSHVVLDLDHEDLLVVADEDSAPAVGGQDTPNLNGHYFVLHVETLVPESKKTSRFAGGAEDWAALMVPGRDIALQCPRPRSAGVTNRAA